ncbi:MAG: mechanosensitive ion channel family protein [Alphaproteobacteria bacterium]
MELQFESISALVGVYALKVLIALAIFFIGKFIAKRVVKILETLMRKSNIDNTLVSFAGNVIYGLALAFVVIAALSQLGINTTSLAAIVAAAGLAIGLSLQESLSNLASGVMIILFRPFKTGDYIEAAGTSGTVEEISIFTTHLKTPDNKCIIVPNGSIISGNITNYSAKPTRRIDLTFGIGYGDDLKKAKKILEKIVKDDKRILKEPEAVIAVSELADSCVNIVVRPWVNSADYWSVYFDLQENVKLQFDKEGISIPYPQQDMHIVYDVKQDNEKKSASKKKAA